MNPTAPTQLPLERILSSLDAILSLVIEAPPGAGKTTRVPPALLQFGGVLVLEPRRLPARMAARRVAWELGEKLGETVGYQVRFEEVAGPRTRLRFVTEGVLNRRLLSDPQLRGVNVVVLDEFHERHLDGDVALALLLAPWLSTDEPLEASPQPAPLPIAGGNDVLRASPTAWLGLPEHSHRDSHY